ncbi:TetR/AcrR family transcriptional regulator [Zavarzinia sp. CC-PAN008]|uniref:TetR/AcrR family transcriptional regulator n=1 Tax=Zavarzinia sp. CC-PAN008 TaxID=3243332 RepID=UPI003F7463C0
MSDAATKPPASPPRPRRKRLSREERARQNYDALINAAAGIVGEDGYAGASIARVTARAGLALGTFYQYFESRQDLFDQLLPAVGGRMLGMLGREIGEARSALEVETRAARGYFEYARTQPALLRIVAEARVYAPAAYEQHMANVIAHYHASLKDNKAVGDFPAFSAEELEAVGVMLIAARLLLRERFLGEDDVPDHVIRTYLKVVRAIATLPPDEG